MKTSVEPERCSRLIVTRPVMIATTLHESGVLNAGVFGAYTNAAPARIAIAIGRESHTYANVKRSRELAINIPPVELAPAIEIFADEIPPDVSEVEKAGCHPCPSRAISVPGIAECVAIVECRYVTEMDMGYHSLVIVETVGGQVEEKVLAPDGRLDVLKARIFHSVAYPEPVYARFGQVFRVD